MLLAVNKTPLVHAMFPYTDHNNLNFVSVVLKGTFNILDNGSLELAEEQEPLLKTDEYSGDAGLSSLIRESDYSPLKLPTDVCVIGDIVSLDEKPCYQMDAVVQVGNQERIIRAVGDRVWEKELGSVRMSGPTPFTRIPVAFEHAFGGKGQESEAQETPYYASNPVGKGYVANSDEIDGLALPNLENSRSLIQSPTDKPQPCCPGFVNRNWQPRASYAGTCDENWQNSRMPLLPTDFGSRFYNASEPDFIFPMLQGGEVIAMKGFNPEGLLGFLLPSWKLEVRYCLKSTVKTLYANLDTVVVLTNKKQVLLNWRVCFPCGLDMLYLKWLEIKNIA